MTRPLFILPAMLAVSAALAFDLQPGLYEQSGNTTYDDFIEGQTFPQPPRSPSIWGAQKVCIPADSAAWLAHQLHGQFQARYPQAKIERDPSDTLYGRRRGQVYRLTAPITLRDPAERLLAYTANVSRSNSPDAAPQDFMMQFAYETQRGQRIERSHSNAFYRYLGADCGATALGAVDN